MHYSCVPFPYFTVAVYIFPFCTFFILHYFHVARFLSSNLFMLPFFRLALFLRFALFHCALLQAAVFSFCILPIAALFACCNFFVLHFIHVALILEVYPGLSETSKMERFTAILNKTIKHCCKALHLSCSRGFWLRLYYFHVSLFLLQFFNIKIY